jgi:hypothetical protein
MYYTALYSKNLKSGIVCEAITDKKQGTLIVSGCEDEKALFNGNDCCTG